MSNINWKLICLLLFLFFFLLPSLLLLPDRLYQLFTIQEFVSTLLTREGAMNPGTLSLFVRAKLRTITKSSRSFLVAFPSASAPEPLFSSQTSQSPLRQFEHLLSRPDCLLQSYFTFWYFDPRGPSGPPYIRLPHLAPHVSPFTQVQSYIRFNSIVSFKFLSSFFVSCSINSSLLLQQWIFPEHGKP